MKKIASDRGRLLISLRGVDVCYRRRFVGPGQAQLHNVLESFNLDIFSGEKIGVVGGNGAGKSTLLRVIGGIILPDRGRVFNYGASVSLLTLDSGFNLELSGRDNTVFNLMLMGFTRKQALEKVDGVAEFAGLKDFLDEPVKIYSTGMRARLGFSINLKASPDVLLLDEVLSVGDQDFRLKAEAQMREKFGSEQTIVLVSHAKPLMERLCSRIVNISSN